MSGRDLLSADRMRQTARSCGWTMEELGQRYLRAARKDLDALAEALASDQAEDASRIAHGLAGASEMAGVTGMGALLRRIEQAARSGDLDTSRALAREAEAGLAQLQGLLGGA